MSEMRFHFNLHSKMDEEEDLTCGTPLDHFAESKELSSIVSTLPQVCGELRPSENAIEKFTGMYLYHTQLQLTTCLYKHDCMFCL